MGVAGEEENVHLRTLLETPTWALATICSVFIFLGVLIEYLIHLLAHWLKKRRKNALFEAVEKLKSVLMLLGFMSLILAVTQEQISKICISNKLANSFLPCHNKTTKDIEFTKHVLEPYKQIKSEDERLLAETYSPDHCGSKGKTSLISAKGITELSTFMGVLAVMQIVYSVSTMALGSAKMRRWKAWEKETHTVQYLAANDPNRFRLTRETTFGRRHLSTCSRTSTQTLWIKCFFRQFFHSVAKVDYLTLRHGFIVTHISANNAFNFQKYIQRSLEDDLKVVVGIRTLLYKYAALAQSVTFKRITLRICNLIRPFMWHLVVILKLLDIHGWHVYLWVSVVPLIIVLVLGTKMEAIVAEMAKQLIDQSNVTKGTPLVQLNDNLFWFSHPNFVLILIHYILFLNAFEVAFFGWVSIQFGLRSCYHEDVGITICRVLLAVIVQVICSYITLPLYALVTQMGTQFKRSVLEEHTMHAIRQWHTRAKVKRKTTSPRDDPSTDLSSHRKEMSFDEYVFSSNGMTGETKENLEEIVSCEASSLRMSSIDDIRIEISETR